jgi:hypothetical protein
MAVAGASGGSEGGLEFAVVVVVVVPEPLLLNDPLAHPDSDPAIHAEIAQAASMRAIDRSKSRFLSIAFHISSSFAVAALQSCTSA